MEYSIHLLKIVILSISLMIHAQEIDISSISKKIYQNECASNPVYLVHWNGGENFPSLGIGHFIWYPKGIHEQFDESFPQLIRYMQKEGVVFPLWLTKEAPWKNKKEMLADRRILNLRSFLEDSIELQSSFMQWRLEKSLPKILASLSPSKAKRVKENFSAVANRPRGYYLLIDYLNFKGNGLKQSERYKNQGWGLLQVLECMKTTLYPKKEFAKCAKKLLYQRVQNSPKNRDEKQWLKGWFNRINSYVE